MKWKKNNIAQRQRAQSQRSWNSVTKLDLVAILNHVGANEISFKDFFISLFWWPFLILSKMVEMCQHLPFEAKDSEKLCRIHFEYYRFALGYSIVFDWTYNVLKIDGDIAFGDSMKMLDKNFQYDVHFRLPQDFDKYFSY